jgi:hypothetical protein
MKKIYYEKVGRRYVPVAEYNEEWLDSFRKGTHLVMSYPGGSSRRYNVDPNHAAMIAAGRVAEDAMCQAIRQASELRPRQTPITPGQKAAWEKLAQEFGDELATLQIDCARDIAEAGIKALMDEAARLMSNPAVKDAYEQFQTVCKLINSTPEE